MAENTTHEIIPQEKEEKFKEEKVMAENTTHEIIPQEKEEKFKEEKVSNIKFSSCEAIPSINEIREEEEPVVKESASLKNSVTDKIPEIKRKKAKRVKSFEANSTKLVVKSAIIDTPIDPTMEPKNIEKKNVLKKKDQTRSAVIKPDSFQTHPEEKKKVIAQNLKNL